jgi:folate/biopterin transporter
MTASATTGGGGDIGPEGLAAEADAEQRARLLPTATAQRRRPPPAPLFSVRMPRALAAVLSGGDSAAASPSNDSSDPDHVTYSVGPELVAIAAVYFVQGSLGLSRLAVSFFLKDDLELGPAQVALLTSLAAAPWVIKPLYGFISDAVPLFGYRRRSYLVLCGLLGAASWLALAGVVSSPVGAGLALLLGALSTAASDVVVDSVVVERARGEPQSAAGGLQSLCWASSAVGGIASAYFSGSLVEAWGVRPVFAATALFPLIVSLSSLLIDEEKVVLSSDDTGASAAQATTAPSTASALVAQARALLAAISRRDILLPTAFVFLWQATPTPDTAMFYFYTNALQFDAEFLGRVRLAGSVASLLGVLVYNRALKKVPLRKVLAWAMGLGVALGSTQLLLVTGANRGLGIPDRVFVLGDSVVLTALAQLSFMPILVLAARLCPEGVEASLFATLMSVLNGGAFVGSALGGAMTAGLGVTADEFGGLPALVLACNLLTLLPAPFLRLLPPDVDDEDGEGGLGGKGGGKVELAPAGDLEDGGGGAPTRRGSGSGSGSGLAARRVAHVKHGVAES